MTRHPLTLLGPLAILRALGKLEVARPELVSVDHVPPDEPESEPPHAPLRTGRASPAAPALAMLAVVLAAVAAHPIPAAGAEIVGRSPAPEVAAGAPEGLPPEVWEAMLRRIRADRSALRGRPHVADGTDGTPALTEDAKLTASDAAQNDDFGASVAVSGITVVVGAPFDDDNGDASGSAYVFVRPVGGWTGALTEDAKLTASDGAAGDRFGHRVAISGDTVVVGAPFDDDNGDASGSAYVFVRPVGGWTGALTEDAKLTASDGAANDVFGSVAISGDTVVAGAEGDDDSGSASGSAYVFVRAVGGWTGALTEDAKLTASDGAADHGFGFSVAISGDTVVAGALGDDSFSGSAYVFVRPVGGWAGSLTENAKLTASDGAANDLFSTSTAISGNVVVAGAPDADGFSGSAYVFARPVGGWAGSLTENAKLTASDGAAMESFATSTAISGNVVVAGAAFGSSAYLFVEPVGGWAGSLTEDAELTASDGDPADQLGFSIAIWGNTVVAGAPSDDVNPGDAAGSAYVFSVQPPEIFDDGFESGDTSAWSQTVP